MELYITLGVAIYLVIMFICYFLIFLSMAIDIREIKEKILDKGKKRN